MKKILALLILLASALFLLASCQIGGEEQKPPVSDGGNNGGAENEDSEFTVWSPDVTLKIVTPDDSDADIQALLDGIYEITGSSPHLISDGEKAGPNELVVGRAERNISNAAYRRLERLTELGEGYAGYVIYAKDGSLAIAYDTLYSLDAAIDYLFDSLATPTLTLEAGEVHSERFRIVEYVADKRNEKRNELFDKLVPTLGEGTVSALRQMYTLYDQELYLWIANLYDPNIGGFYFSNSGRDNEGFLPDLESTAQALSHLQSGGMFAEQGGYKYGLPEQTRNQLIAFTKGLQDPDDGYFYHPQWGKEIIAARRGRDLGWATGLLGNLGVKPLYDAPDGTKGELGAPGGASAVNLTGRLTGSVRSSVATAASKVISVSKSSLPEYLRDLGKWADYIEMLNIPGDSYVAGNTLAAQHGQIKLAGKEYIDYLINYLNEHQHPHNGLWEMETNYNTVNGLMKLASVYNYYSATIPNAEKALESAITVALQPDGDTHVCSVYNPWVCMDIILNSILNSDGTARRDELRAIILERSEELVEITFDKVADYYVDGGFHYHRSTIGHSSQGALVSCNTEFEADVNASAICSTGIIGYMSRTFGITRVPLYFEDDTRYFLDTLMGLGTIIKAEVPPVETVTFDEYSSALGEEAYGVTYFPDAKVQTVIKEGDKLLGENGGMKYFATSVVRDPYPSKESDLALKINTFVHYDKDGNRELPASAMSTKIDIENHFIVGNTFIYDVDMLVVSGNGVFQQIFFSTTDSSNSFSLNLQIYAKGDKNYIKIYDNYEGPDGEKDTNIVDGIPAEEWFNLRIELYKLYAETSDGAGTKKLTIKAKIFVNGEYVGESEASNISSKGAVIDRAIDSVTLSHYRFSQTEVYIDNVHAEKSSKQYVYEQVPVDPSSIPSSVPTPRGEPTGGAYYLSAESFGKKYDFSGLKKPPALSNSVSGRTYLTEDGRVFFWRLGEAGGIHEATSHQGVAASEEYQSPVAVFELDAAFGNIDPSTSYAVMFCLFGNGMRSSLYMSADKDGMLKLENGVETSQFKPLSQNEWYNFTFEMYNVSDTVSRIKVYINGEFAAEYAGVDYFSATGEKINLQLQSTDTDSWMLYDNLFAGQIDKEYVAAKEKAPDNMPEITDPNGVRGSGVYYNGSLDGVRADYPEGAMKPALSQGAGPANTYLTDEGYVYYYRSESGAVSYLPIEAGSLKKPDNVKYLTAIVEGDFAFGRVDEAYVAVLGFYGNGRRVNIFFSANSDGRIIFPHMKKPSSFEGLQQDIWYNLRFELYYLGEVSEGDASMAVRLYVNGEYACDIAAVDVSAYTSNRLLLQIQNRDTDLWWAFDNIYLGYVDMEYTAPPTPEAPDPDDPDPEEPIDPDPDDPDPEEPIDPNPDDPDPEEPIDPNPDDPDPEEPTDPDPDDPGEGGEEPEIPLPPASGDGVLPGGNADNYDSTGGWTEP